MKKGNQLAMQFEVIVGKLPNAQFANLGVFIDRVIEEEREACAKILEEAASGASGLKIDYLAQGMIAAADTAETVALHLTMMANRIRARGSE